jgi:hypothetical protein
LTFRKLPLGAPPATPAAGRDLYTHRAVFTCHNSPEG